MVNFNEISAVGSIIAVVVAFISCVGTLGTLWLIYDMNRWNAYMRLIFNLTICQLIADSSFFFSPFTGNPLYFSFGVFLYTFGSISVSLWTNLISCSLFTVVLYQQNLDLKTYFRQIRIAILLPGLIIAILFVIYLDDYYNILFACCMWSQICSIVFNVAVHTVVSIELYNMRNPDYDDPQSEETNVENGNGSVSSNPGPAQPGVRDSEQKTRESLYKMNIFKPISELARRLKYYPIVQSIAVAGLAWYFLQFHIHLFGEPHDASLEAVSWYAYSILTPSTGIGYFIVFLSVQPFAYRHLCDRVNRMFCVGRDERVDSIQSDSYREPSTTSTRVTERESRMTIGSSSTRLMHGSSFSSDESVKSNSTMATNAQSNNFHTTNSQATSIQNMDEDMLIEQIKGMYDAHKFASNNASIFTASSTSHPFSAGSAGGPQLSVASGSSGSGNGTPVGPLSRNPSLQSQALSRNPSLQNQSGGAVTAPLSRNPSLQNPPVPPVVTNNPIYSRNSDL